MIKLLFLSVLIITPFAHYCAALDTRAAPELDDKDYQEKLQRDRDSQEELALLKAAARQAQKDAASASAGSRQQQEARTRAEQSYSGMEKIGRQRPDDSQAQHAVGETLYSVGEYKRVLPFAQREIELEPDKPEGYVLAALAYQKMKKYKEAYQAAGDALKRDPNNKVAIAIQNLTGYRPEAMTIQKPPAELMRSAPMENLELGPPSNEGRDLLENQAKANANHIEAERFAKEAANKMKMEDTAAARRLLDKALVLEPQDAVKLTLRASLHLKLGDVKSAFADANAAIAAKDQSGLAYVLRARAMAALMPEYTPEQVLADYGAAAEYQAPILVNPYQLSAFKDT